jgi:predicted  nucleic acid-binding Zn-ribbon protein
VNDHCEQCDEYQDDIDALTERAETAERELTELRDRHKALTDTADNATESLRALADALDRHL